MLNWAIIGSGDVVNRLVKNSFNVTGTSKVKYIYSDNLHQAKLLAKKYKFGAVTNSLNAIMNDNNVNSIYIATPPNSHAFYIKKFSKVKKYILCEKPLTIKKKELKEIINLCRKNKVSLITSFYRRYLKRFLEIKKIVQSNKIGKIITFNYRLFHSPQTHPTAKIKKNMKNIPWRFQKKISGGGNFLDMGAHAIDMISFLMGDIKKVQSLKKNYLKLYNVEDTLVTNIELKNKIIGQATWSSVTDKTDDLFEIFGTKGSISFSLNFSNKVNIRKKNKNIFKNIPFDTPFHKNLILDTISKFTSYKKKNRFKIEKHGIDAALHQFSVINSND